MDILQTYYWKPWERKWENMGTPSVALMSNTCKNLESALNQETKVWIIQNIMFNNIMVLWEHTIPFAPRK